MTGQLENDAVTGIGRGKEVMGDNNIQKLKGKLYMDSDVGHTNKEMGSLQSPHIFEAGQSSIGLEKIGPNSLSNHSRGEAFRGVFDSQLTKSIAGNDKGVRCREEEDCMVEFDIEDEREGRKWKCGRKGATTDGGAAPVEGDTMVEMVDTGRFIMGCGKEVQGDGHHGKETRKRVSIKNKARAKAKMGGSQVACILSEKKKMEAGAVGLPEVGVLDGNEGNRGCDSNSEVGISNCLDLPSSFTEIEAASLVNQGRREQ
uniref:Uncharacterized protein n=1 Tax=Cannabis sativa TaxID=3483 RepID=A0A803Q8A8_CANSA